jgi:hypothetical protein
MSNHYLQTGDPLHLSDAVEALVTKFTGKFLDTLELSFDKLDRAVDVDILDALAESALDKAIKSVATAANFRPRTEKPPKMAVFRQRVKEESKRLFDGDGNFVKNLGRSISSKSRKILLLPPRFFHCSSHRTSRF